MSVVDKTSLTEIRHDDLVALAAIDLLTVEPAWRIETVAVLFNISVHDLQARINAAIDAAERRPIQRTR